MCSLHSLCSLALILSLANSFLFFGEPEKKKYMKMKGGLRPDNRIERARARHQFARLVMGAIFLVCLLVVK